MVSAATTIAVMLFASKTICGHPVPDQAVITAVYAAAHQSGRTYNDTFDLVHEATANVRLNLNGINKREAWCQKTQVSL